MMTPVALRRCRQGDRTLADLIDRLERADSATVPPLTLVADSV